MYTRKPSPRGFPFFLLIYEVMEEKKMTKTCNNCGTKNQNVMVPYVVHEAEVTRQERHAKRMWVALIIVTILCFLTNIFWLTAWMSYDYSSTTEEIIVEQDAQDGGSNNYIGNNGDINNGVSENNNSQEEEIEN